MNILLLATQNANKGRELAELARGRFLVRTLADVGLASLDVEETGSAFADNALIKARAVKAALSPGTARETAWVLADDSGLMVDALDGAPGVRSARFAADHGTGEGDLANNALLLLLLDPVPDERRTARFACAVCALAVEGNDVHQAFATVEGRIARDRAGTGGFGYDPLFIPAVHAPIQRGSFGLIEPGAGVSGEPKEHRRRVAIATCRGRDAGIAGKTKPGDESTQVIPAVSMAELSAEQKHAISHRGQAMRALLATLEGGAQPSVFARARPSTC